MTTLRQRIPWKNSYSQVPTEDIELGEISGEGIGITETEAITLLEEIEAGGLILDESVIGSPVGILVGVLGVLGYTSYEIYTYFQKEKHNEYTQKLKSISEKQIQEELNKLHEKTNRRGFVVPPYKYLGPGNDLNRGEPYNEIDSDARIHDIEYSKARNIKNILKSDKNFINKAGDHIIEGIKLNESPSNIIGSIIGGTGISSKHLIEKNTGKSLYPTFSG